MTEFDLRLRLSDLTRLVSDWFWETNLEFKLVNVSDRVVDALGLHPIQLIGKSLLDIGTFTTNEGGVVDVDWHLPFRELPFSAVDRNGKLQIFLVSGLPVFDPVTGDLIGAHGISRKITDWKQAEQAVCKTMNNLTTEVFARERAEIALNKRTALVDLLRRTARNANMSTDFETAMQACLTTMCEYTDWPVGHAYVVSEDHDGSLIPSNIWHFDDPKLFANFRHVTEQTNCARGSGLPGRVLATGTPAWISDVNKDANFPHSETAYDNGIKAGFAFPVIHKKETVAVLEFYATEAVEPDAEILDVMADVGTQLGWVYERKRAASKLRAAMCEIDAANYDLERKIQIRTQELCLAKLEAETASQSKSEFLANMSHELRTPLNAIIGFSEMMTEAMVGPLNKPYQEYAADIYASGNHLLGIISDILDVSMVEAGRLEIEEENVDVETTATACKAMLLGHCHDAGVELVLEVPADLPILFVDPLRLKQILLNLISNALKFTPEGGLVTLSGELNFDGGVVLKVTDTGIGIPEEDISKVLERFGQSRDGYTHPHDGAGLGLTLSKYLTELHGGKLKIASEVNNGTTVTLWFPSERTRHGLKTAYKNKKGNV